MKPILDQLSSEMSQKAGLNSDSLYCGLVKTAPVTTGEVLSIALRRLTGIRIALLAALVSFMLTVQPVHAERVIVAVATNFFDIARQLEAEFEAASDHQIDLVPGSTGRLYAQLKNGAPYAILLAADAHRPRLLEQDGLIVPGSRKTYAVGRLALFRRAASSPEEAAPTALRAGGFRTLAIADPRLAPYGVAAVEALARLGIQEELTPRLVIGESVGQVTAFLATSNADFGFLSWSHAIEARRRALGDFWLVPENLHNPIVQQAVLLLQAGQSGAALEFYRYLCSDQARDVIMASGYLGATDVERRL